MKLKLAIGVALFIGVSAAADAAPAASGISIGGLLTPGIKIVDSLGPLLNPVLQPVLAVTGPFIGHDIIPKLHPIFVLVGDLTGDHGGSTGINLANLPLPGLPN